MCFTKCGAKSLGAVLEGQKLMYLSHGRVPYQTASFNDTILLHILYGSHVHILNKNYQNVYALILHVSYHIQYLFIYIFINCKGIKHLHGLILCVSYQYLSLLLYIHIDYKNIKHLHVLTLYDSLNSYKLTSHHHLVILFLHLNFLQTSVSPHAA